MGRGSRLLPMSAPRLELTCDGVVNVHVHVQLAVGPHTADDALLSGHAQGQVHVLPAHPTVEYTAPAEPSAAAAVQGP